MIYLRLTAVIFLTFFTTVGSAETLGNDAATIESRDASVAYIGTANFVVGRVGRDCLANLGRTETLQAFVSVWQQRNMKYLMASQKYISTRLDEAEAVGGARKRNAIMGALTDVVRRSAESAVESWLGRPDKNDACKRAVTIIESGAYDFLPTSPMFGELESLVAWTQR